jgi:hypothetical protein
MGLIMNEAAITELVLSLNQQVESTAIQSAILRNLVVSMCAVLNEEQKRKIIGQMSYIHREAEEDMQRDDIENLVIQQRARSELAFILQLIE